MKNYLILALLSLSIGLGGAADSTNAPVTAASLVSKLKFQSGQISLKNGLATLNLPDGFRYLSPADTEIVLVDLWGNPQGSKTLGMIVPSADILTNDSSWAVIIEYEEDGHVKDADADKIDYPKMLKEMQQGCRDANKERKKEGYPEVELVGWATAPHYDNQARKLYWAKELKFSGHEGNTLNYNIRVLGRRGVLILNTVASMRSFSEIEQQTPDIVKMVDFNPGHRYADFDGKTDKTAAYGLAALVAGGIAAKAGLFKLLWVGLIAAKKFIIIGAIALYAFIKKLLGKTSGSSQT